MVTLISASKGLDYLPVIVGKYNAASLVSKSGFTISLGYMVASLMVPMNHIGIFTPFCVSKQIT